ncbi:hypothetical protein ACYJ1Y_11480 [Natrialbaceae archaeon A-gly3]
MSGQKIEGDEESTTTRRGFLERAGLAVGAPVTVGTGVYGADRSYADADGDGVPDSLEQSSSFHRRLEDRFGADQFDGLDPGRKDLLIDVRSVGEASVSGRTASRMEELFRENGIHLQWLEYPERYDREWFEAEYGYHAKDILWSPRSFYHEQIADDLKNVALQVIVVPGRSEPQSYGRLDSFWADLRTGRESFSGMSVGNRAVVAEQQSRLVEFRLVLHEIGHLTLCHDDDPENTGVMGVESPTAKSDLMDWEWEHFRGNLENIRDTTGFDVAARPCLWGEYVVDPLTERL